VTWKGIVRGSFEFLDFVATVVGGTLGAVILYAVR
jgi:hypothetical protein